MTLQEEIESDTNAIKAYMGKGHSAADAYRAFLKVFRGRNNGPKTKEQKARYKRLSEFIKNFDINAGWPRKTTMPIPGLKNQPTKLSAAVKTVADELKSDKAFREAWSANIAMAFKDNYGQYKKKTGKTVMNKEDLHIIANESAEYFLQLLCDEIKYPEGR